MLYGKTILQKLRYQRTKWQRNIFVKCKTKVGKINGSSGNIICWKKLYHEKRILLFASWMETLESNTAFEESVKEKI